MLLTIFRSTTAQDGKIHRTQCIQAIRIISQVGLVQAKIIVDAVAGLGITITKLPVLCSPEELQAQISVLSENHILVKDMNTEDKCVDLKDLLIKAAELATQEQKWLISSKLYEIINWL